jgi:hypothetical protein
MRRFVLLFIAPPLLVIGLVVLPLLTGERTLYLRDVMNAHLPLKVTQAAALQDGELPLVDLQRSGGQPQLGNPNGLFYYPDSLLLLAADPIWAMNAHFWIHWLLAPFAFCWLGRSLGLSRGGAWAAGVLYATGGFFLSLLNLYNLISVAALAPAFVAAGLDACAAVPPGGRLRPGRWPLLGLMCCLLLLAGDPFSALQALLLLAAALLFKGGWRAVLLPGWRLPAALGIGLAISLPVWVELARILPASFRASVRGVGAATLTQSVAPPQLVEAIFPSFFGRYDSTFWGRVMYDHGEPLIISLFPGLLALALLPLAAGRRLPLAGRLGWTALLGGLFCAFGSHNPLMVLLYELPGMGLLRFPVKFLLLSAIGLALLGGVACERLLEGDAWRRLRPGLWLALAGYFAFFLVVIRAPQLLDRLLLTFDHGLPQLLLSLQRGRMGAIALTLAATALALLLGTLLARRSPKLALALLLLLQATTQTALLDNLYETDQADFYRQRPELDAKLPAGARVVHAAFASGALGRVDIDPRRLPDLRLIWQARCNHQEMGATAGLYFGREYELNFTPEGLDSYFSVFLGKWLENRSDAERIRFLAASGVDVAILPRALEGVDPADASLLDEFATVCNPVVKVYRLPKALPPHALLGGIRRAGSAGAAAALLVDPALDPRAAAVLPRREQSGADADAPRGEILELSESREEVTATVDSEDGGVFATRRAYLPIYRAEVDGRPALPEVLNGHRLGVEVPAGRHRVRLWVDRRPTVAALAVSAAALLALAGWALAARRAGRGPSR